MKPIEEFLKEMNSESKDALLLLRETAQLVSYYRRLLERFELDALTGLMGANKYHEFKTELAEKPPKTLGVIVFDVNDLKYYNDNKGHQAGDILLQKAADSFLYISEENMCRKPCEKPAGAEACDDSVPCLNMHIFRTGGDEFVALIPNCSEGELFGVIAIWKEKLAELNAADDGIHCSIAYGAAFGKGKYRIGDVLQLADDRMYGEKQRMKSSGEKLGDVR